jgi:flagellar protein FliS
MNKRSPAETYAAEQIEHAPPIKIVRLLYQGALRFLDRALAADPHNPASRFDEWTCKAEDIVMELRLALEARHAPTLAAQLDQLYDFAESELRRARAERTQTPVRAVREILSRLAEAWCAVSIEDDKAAS